MPHRGTGYYYPGGPGMYQRRAVRAVSAEPDYQRARSVFSPVNTMERAMSVAREYVEPSQLDKSLVYTKKFWDTYDTFDRSRYIADRIARFKLERALNNYGDPSYEYAPRRNKASYPPILHSAYPYSSYYSPYVDPYYPYSSKPYRPPYSNNYRPWDPYRATYRRVYY